MKKIVMGLLAIILAASCTREAEYVPVCELGSPQSEGFLSVTADGGSVVCEVYANGDYSAALESDWLYFEGFSKDVRVRSLNGDSSFGVSMDENPGETRYGTIKLEMGSRRVSITVRQRGKLSSDAGIIATLVSSTPSSLTIGWTRDVDGETSPDPDYAYPYRFSLFRDAGATDLVVSHTSTASEACWNKTAPSFAFGGLKQGSTYYFLCEQIETDTEGNVTAVQHSDVLEVSTPEFTPVTIPDTPAGVGDVILAEDWSMCPWLSDMVSKSAGFIPPEDKRTSLDGPSGASPEGTLRVWSAENEIFTTSYKNLIEESRIGVWAKRYDHDITGRTSVYMHAGHIKIGGDSYTAHLASPALSCIPEGYEATLEVNVRLARYDNDSDMTFLGSAPGTEGYNTTYGRYFKPAEYDSPGVHFAVSKGWNYYKLQLQHVRRSSHLLLGPDFEGAHSGNGASQHRLLIGDISVKITALTQVQDLSVSNVRFSDARLTWSLLDDTSVTAYELWLNGEKYGSYATDVNSVTLTGLALSTRYEAVVKAIRQNTDSTESESICFTTKGLRCYKAFPERICVEWDDLVPAESYGSNTYARAYQIEVYRDEALTDMYISAYSYNGSGKDEGVFPGKPDNAQVCGMTAGVANPYPTRATAPALSPSTNYWFRVRSVDGVQVSNLLKGTEVTLTNVAGTSEWSQALSVATLAARTPSAKEVVFQGFDHFTVGADWTCYAAGIGPKLQTPSQFASMDMSSYSGEWCMYGMYSYSSMRMPLWGLCSPVEGSGNSYLDSSTFSYGSWSRTNYVDAAGWHYDGQLGALMGQLHLCDMVDASKAGCFFGTPRLENNLSDEPKACTVSLKAFFTSKGNVSYTSTELQVFVLHTDTGVIDAGPKMTLPVKYTVAKPDNKNYQFDVSFTPLSADVSLKKGDVVIVSNITGSRRVIVDDFLVELK